MTVPPPPPDRSSAFEMRGPPLPARGYAIGVAIAGVGAVLYQSYFGKAALRLDDDPNIHLAMSFAYVLAGFGGAVGGWLSWRWFTRGLPVSWLRALGVAVASIVSSLMIGCLAGGLIGSVVSIVGAASSGTAEGAVGALFMIYSSLIIGPLFAIWLFGRPFAILVLVWTLLWRYLANRRAAV